MLSAYKYGANIWQKAFRSIFPLSTPAPPNPTPSTTSTIGIMDSTTSDDANLKALPDTVESFKGSERVVNRPEAPRADDITPFKPHPKLAHQHGDKILVIVPTENESKVALITKKLRDRASDARKDLQLLDPFGKVQADSDVGEQPYNLKSGLQGAHNRISNALNKLSGDDKFVSSLEKNQVGTLMIASIENYIQIEGVNRPADHGLVLVYNVTTDNTVIALSRGVTIDPAFVKAAQEFGFKDDNPNFGNKTVGEILSERFNGVDKADWHKVVTEESVSRYDLLGEAFNKLDIPW